MAECIAMASGIAIISAIGPRVANEAALSGIALYRNLRYYSIHLTLSLSKEGYSAISQIFHDHPELISGNDHTQIISVQHGGKVLKCPVPRAGKTATLTLHNGVDYKIHSHSLGGDNGIVDSFTVYFLEIEHFMYFGENVLKKTVSKEVLIELYNSLKKYKSSIKLPTKIVKAKVVEKGCSVLCAYVSAEQFGDILIGLCRFVQDYVRPIDPIEDWYPMLAQKNTGEYVPFEMPCNGTIFELEGDNGEYYYFHKVTSKQFILMATDQWILDHFMNSEFMEGVDYLNRLSFMNSYKEKSVQTTNLTQTTARNPTSQPTVLKPSGNPPIRPDIPAC